MRKAIEMIGRKFGDLLVLAEAEVSKPRNKAYVVRCVKCNSETTMLGGNIRRAERTGKSGCQCSSAARKHGFSAHLAYKTWEGMIARCYNQDHQAFHRYGGRGVGVCDEWKADPVAFIAWLDLNGWHKGLEIDRRENDGPYSPGNCRVVTSIVNANNRSTNRLLCVGDENLTVSEAARKFGLLKTTIKERLNRGWSDVDAVRPV